MPLNALLPDHAPDAVQAAALVEDQVNIAVLPLGTLVGFALMDTVGFVLAGVTLTVAVCDAEPPVPAHVSVYWVLALKAAVFCDPPLAASLPLQPPEAVQEVALVEDQIRVEVPPLDTALGLALKLSVGAAPVAAPVAVIVTDCTALPPAPAQLSVYVVSLLRTPVECDPLVAWLPIQPPEAVQAVALVDDHDTVELAPFAIVLGLADKRTDAVGVAVTVMVEDCTARPPGPMQTSV